MRRGLLQRNLPSGRKGQSLLDLLLIIVAAVPSSWRQALPKGAIVIETVRVSSSLHGDCLLALWMSDSHEHTRDFEADEPYTCPDETRGSRFVSGRAAVSVIDVSSQRIINWYAVDLDVREGVRTDHYSLHWVEGLFSPTQNRAGMTIRLVTLVLCAVAVASPKQAPPPTRIAGPGYEGPIISAEAQLNSDPRHVFKPSDVWTPSESIVREAEARLPAYVNSSEAAAALRGSRIRAELPHYRRQYWGIVRQQRREILIHFYHEETSVGRKGSWLRGIVAVAGGGDQFFRITYQVHDKRFTGLQINAPE